MSIDIRPIKILFDTNIPGKQLVPFTKSLLYNPELKDTSGLDEYPNFTMDVLFPFSYLTTLSYEKQIKFFFNKSEMIKVLKIYKPVLFKETSNNDEIPEILTSNDQNKIKEENEKERRKKERIVDLKEQIQKKTAERKKYEIESKNNEELKKINEIIKKKTDENKKKEKEYEAYIQSLSQESIKTRLDEIFKPDDPTSKMTEPPTDNIKFYEKFFEGKKKRSDVQTDALDYIKDTKNLLVKLKNEFLIYLNEEEESKYNATLAGINKIDIKNAKRGQIDNDLWNLYTFIKKLPNEIEPIAKIIEPYIKNHLLDKGNDELTILENKKTTEAKKIEEYMQKLKEQEIDLTKQKTILEKELIDNTMINTPRIISADDIKKQKIAKAKFQTKNGDENVLMMLRLLFPTKYPIIGNTFSSFNSLILQKSDFNMTFRDFLPSFLKNKLIEGTSSYSYVKIDGKIYTVAQAVWLNDIYNHKEYADLIDKFKKLKLWKDKANSKLSDEITTKLNKFKSNYANGFDTSDISYIKTQSKNIDDLSNISGYAKDKLQADYTTYNSTLDDFINTINIFQSSIENETNDTISDNAKNMVETYKIVTKYGTNFFKPKDKFNKIIDNVNRDLEEIRINEYIREKYMSKPGVDLDYEKDDPKYSSRLKSNFKEYTEFVDNIKQFRSPNKESSNYHLQETFNEFLENREKYKGIFNFLMNPYNININPFDKIKKTEVAQAQEFIDAKEDYHKRKNTGVNILPSVNSTEPGYEIYVQLNVIGGELNDTNKSLVDCLYQGESLGNKMEYLVNESLRNPWDINTTRLFFDITQGDAVKELEKKKLEDQSNGTTQKPEITNQTLQEKKGGNIKYNMNTRKLRSNIIKTHKKRF